MLKYVQICIKICYATSAGVFQKFQHQGQDQGQDQGQSCK